MTPQGSLSYSQTGTNSDGTPQYTQTQTLSPDEQTKYNLNNQVAIALDGLANQSVGQVQNAMSSPLDTSGNAPIVSNVNGGPIQSSLDYSGLQAIPTSNDFSADNQTQANAVYQQAASRLDPQWQQNDSNFASQMAAQGISQNSDAYRRAYQNESMAKNDAYNQAQLTATQAGAAEQSTLYNEALSGRQQGVNEINDQGTFANTSQNQTFNQGLSNAQLSNSAAQQQLQQEAYLRNMPINDIAALLGTGAGVAQPTFQPVSQVGVAAPDYAGLVQSNYQDQTAQYNQQQASQAQMLGSIFGSLGSLGGAAILSDRRFKENIKAIGTLANGIATYAFNYIGDKAQQFGVMAQEVLNIIPEAVSHDADGYMRVDYGKVYA